MPIAVKRLASGTMMIMMITVLLLLLLLLSMLMLLMEVVNDDEFAETLTVVGEVSLPVALDSIPVQLVS